MVEVRAICRFYVISKGCFFFLFGEALQHPGHVAADVAHGLQAFQVFAYFVRRHAMDHVPIRRRDDGHAGDAEVFIQSINGCRRAAAAGRNDSCAGFAGKDGIKFTDGRRIENAVQERQNLSAGMSEVNGRPKDEAVGFFGFFQEAVDGIVVVVFENTAIALAFITADTVADRASA